MGSAAVGGSIVCSCMDVSCIAVGLAATHVGHGARTVSAGTGSRHNDTAAAATQVQVAPGAMLRSPHV